MTEKAIDIWQRLSNNSLQIVDLEDREELYEFVRCESIDLLSGFLIFSGYSKVIFTFFYMSEIDQNSNDYSILWTCSQ